MKIASIQAFHVRVAEPDVASADQAQEALVLLIATDDGRVGLAECNHSPAAALAFLDAPSGSSQTRNLRELLLGREITHPSAMRVELLRCTQSSARRGIGLAVVNAIDVALWDLWSQARNEPLWRTLHGETAHRPQAYATLYTGPGTYGETVRRLRVLVERATAAGYAAIKIEPLDECVPEDRISAYVTEGRRLVGEEVELLVDVYHRFATPGVAARAIAEFRHLRPNLVETPLPLDDVAGYAELVRLTDVPVAASELYESPAEFEVLLRFGCIPVAQPWPNRLGVSGTLEVIDACRRLGRSCVLAGWNATAIGVAVGVHVATGLGDGTVLEHAAADVYDGFELRPIAVPEPAVASEGRFVLSEASGLGLELDEERVAFHAVP